MKAARIFLLYTFTLLLFLLFCSQKAFAASAFLTMEPLQKTAVVGQTVNIKLAIDTGGQDILGATAQFIYTPEDIDIVGISTTSWFDYISSHITSSSSQVSVTGGFYPVCGVNGLCDNGSKRVGGATATMAVRLKQVPASGQTTFSYLCGSLNQSSLIIKNPAYDPADNNSIPGIEGIDCNQNKATVIKIGTAPTTVVGITTTPGPLPSGVATCDLCGACQNKQGVVSKPADWDRCRLCLYNTDGSQKPGQAWSGFGCVPVGRGLVSPFMQKLLLTVVGLTGGASFILFLYGGFLLITSRGDQSQIQTGKRVITGAVGTLFIILFSIFILEFIGVHILGLPLSG